MESIAKIPKSRYYNGEKLIGVIPHKLWICLAMRLILRFSHHLTLFMF